MQTTATATGRPCAPVGLPADVKGHLERFGLSLSTLLTDSNPKLGKGAATARAVILHHLPHRALAAALTPGNAGATAPRSFLPDLRALADREGLTAAGLAHNGCPWATAGCATACLAWSGHGGLSPRVAAARGRRTLAMLADPALYGRALLWAIARQWRAAQDAGLPLAVRLRGTDDTPYHRLRLEISAAEAVAIGRRYGLTVIPGDSVTLPEALEPARTAGTLTFYDYSKAPAAGPLGLEAQRAAGFDVTASLAGDRPTAAADAIAAVMAGFRLAVPVALRKGQPIPARVLISHAGQTLALRTVDGDATDHRWQDPAGVAVILRGKRSRGADPDRAGFILPDAPLIRLADGTVQLLPD